MPNEVMSAVMSAALVVVFAAVLALVSLVIKKFKEVSRTVEIHSFHARVRVERY